MRLLIIARCPPWPLHLGDTLVVHHVTRELHGRGHTLDLVCFYQQPDAPDQQYHYRDRFAGITLIREVPRTPLQFIRRLLIPPFFPERIDQAWSRSMWEAVRDHVESTDYDGVILFGGVSVFEYRVLIQHLPNIIVPYDSYTLLLSSQLAQAKSFVQRIDLSLRRWMAAQYEARMFAGYTDIVLLAEPDAQALRQLNPTYQTRVIPPVVDPVAVTTSDRIARLSSRMILFVGNLEYEPNAYAARLLVAQIFPIVQAELPDVELFIVGNAPPVDLQSQTNPQITVTGRVPDVHVYYRQAALFVSPLRFGAGVKNKILESLSAGLPLVLTPVSIDGIPLTNEHAIIAEESDELAHGVITLMSDPDRRAAMSEANMLLARETFSSEASGRAYESLLNEQSATHRPR